MKGIGTDVVSIQRLQKALGRTPGLAGSVFTEGERGASGARRVPVRHLAACFAAKEAFLKALGLGILSGVALHDIEVRQGDGRSPRLLLGPTAAAALARRGGAAPLLSLSGTGDLVLALVLVP
jgi:holo-[acyl-carrier protein] synthase